MALWGCPAHSLILCYFFSVALAVPVAAKGHLTALYLQQLHQLCLKYLLIVTKTFNNGSLGSGIDEERSQMR
jgi:hypothetical protein